MLRSCGKFLQLAALVILPLAMVIQLTREMRATTDVTNLSVMVIFLVFGAALFALGRIIEGYAR
jgi:ABC-type polysaccharide/polyol phosphate export permease